MKSLRHIDYLGLSAALSAKGYVVRKDLSEDPETFHFDFTLPDRSLLIQAYPDIGLDLIVEWLLLSKLFWAKFSTVFDVGLCLAEGLSKREH